MFEHTLSVRVYYADTDALGVVYHANYLRYFESARTESLRAAGFELPFLMSEYGVQFAVVHAAISFKKPARLDDILWLVSKVTAVGRATITYRQEMYLENQDGPLVCSADIKLVTVDQQLRPCSVPSALKTEIMK